MRLQFSAFLWSIITNEAPKDTFFNNQGRCRFNIKKHESTLKNLYLKTCLINFYPRWVFLCIGHEESSSLCVVLHGISLFASPFQYSSPYNFLRSWDLAKYQDFTRLMRTYKQFLLQCFLDRFLVMTNTRLYTTP